MNTSMSNNILLPGDNDTLIKEPQFIPMVIKRLSVANGALTAAAHIKVGDRFWVDRGSQFMAHVTTHDMREYSVPAIYIVDGMGKQLGWMYTELFLDEDVTR